MNEEDHEIARAEGEGMVAKAVPEPKENPLRKLGHGLAEVAEVAGAVGVEIALGAMEKE